MQDYDVIALQEPSYNRQTGGTHCSQGSGFWLAYEPQGRLSWVVLLFNKRLDIGDWGVEQVDNCIQMAQIQTSQGLVQLINVYVMMDESWVMLGSDSALEKVLELFDGDSEGVLLGNFNLHHPFWRGERV